MGRWDAELYIPAKVQNCRIEIPEANDEHAVEQLKQELAIHDVTALEVELKKRIQEWILTVQDSELLQYDVVTVKDLVFAQLRSWC